MHRDIKSANLMLSDETVKLGDLNVSKVPTKSGMNYTQTGTPFYASPEVWRDEPYNNKSDIWSLGCVIYEMMMLRPPFDAQDMQTLFRKILKGQYPRVSSRYSKDLIYLVKNMLNTKANERPSAEDLLQMPIVSSRALKMIPYIFKQYQGSVRQGFAYNKKIS